ncbi:MAG: flagellar motor switch protein FliN [Bdellovibrionaceae bacterium]|nr:flagellar motor switch protein FliN [Pseudobdellovibrionaceae bacterium]MBX3034369.1 flagellar motor switch protein FliN [Pseudobdellovibrionaceae bacterium]
MSEDSLENLADQLAEEAAAMTAAMDGGAAAGNGGGSSAGSGGGFSAGSSGGGAKDRNLQLILDIPLRVTVELGRTKMPVSELLNLTQGSVIELSKLAGEPMEVLVNDKLIARGEAVVVNEKFGVRLTDIISTSERIEQLG